MSHFSLTLISVLGIVVAVGMPLSIPIVWMTLSYRKQLRLMQLHHAERMAAIERGMELPPLPAELLHGRAVRRTALLPGLLWLFAGLGLWLGLASWAQPQSSLAWIPGGVGLAYLVYYFVEERRAPQARMSIHRQVSGLNE